MISTREFYGQHDLDELTLELDYIDTNIHKMDLPTTQTIRLPVAFEYRPDLLSQKYFGNYHMGWLITLHNNFLDPVRDYYVGRLVDIPDLDAYYRFYNNNAKVI